MNFEVVAQSAEVRDACGAEPGVFCEWVYDTTGNENLAGVADWFVERPLRVLVILLVAWVVNRIARRLIARFVAGLVTRIKADKSGRRTDGANGTEEASAPELLDIGVRSERLELRAETLGTVLGSIATIAIYGIAILMALSEFDIDLAPLIAGAGIVGIAVGFGAQSLVRDFLAGIFILMEDQYGVGDVIDIGEATGVVEEVSLRITSLRDEQGTAWHVPNGVITRVGNKSQEWARVVMDIEVAYDTDLAEAGRVIKETADSVWRDELGHATVLEEPQLWGVQSFGSNAIAIRLVVKTEPGEQFNVAREIRGRLKPAFDAVGIDIPFPQRTVWLQRERPEEEPRVSGLIEAHRPPRPGAR